MTIYFDDIRCGIFYFPRKGMVKSIYLITDIFDFSNIWDNYSETLNDC